MTAQARDKVFQQVAITMTAVTGQHGFQKDVLGQQHLRAEAVFDQGDDGPRVFFIAGRLRVLVGEVVTHADHVVFQKRAACRQRVLIRRVAVAGVHVAQHRVAQVGTFRFNDVQHPVAEALPARQMHRKRNAGRGTCTGCGAQ